MSNKKYSKLRKGIKTKDYALVSELILDDDIAMIDIKHDLNPKIIKYFIKNNCKKQVKKILSVKSRTIRAYFDDKKVQDCLRDYLDETTYFIAGMGMVTNKNNLSYILFGEAICKKDLGRLHNFTTFSDFLDIEDLCNYIFNTEGAIQYFLYDVIIKEFGKYDACRWIADESNFDCDDMFEIISMLLDNINEYNMILDRVSGSNREEFISCMKDKFDEGDIRAFAKKNGLMEEFGYGESCEDCESCDTCESCEDCGRRHMDSHQYDETYQLMNK